MAKIEKTIRPADNAADKTIRPKTSVEKNDESGWKRCGENNKGDR